MAATRISNTGKFLHAIIVLSRLDDEVGSHDVSARAVVKYKEHFSFRRSPAFLTYYVFSAGYVVLWGMICVNLHA